MEKTQIVSFGSRVQISIPSTCNVLFLCSEDMAKYCYFVHIKEVTEIPLLVISGSSLTDEELEHIGLCAPKIKI